MSTRMELPVLLINIERAAARRQAIEGQAAALGIKLERVAGVDGSLVPREQWRDVDYALFQRRNARPILPGEYGCYQSHLAAFRQMADRGHQAALIIEDDVALSLDLIDRANAILKVVPDNCVVKLVNHRTVAFRQLARTERGDDVGLAGFGPLGSSACYLVTAEAAGLLSQALARQSLPIDNALERSWDHGVPVYCCRKNLLEFGDLRSETLIASQKDYRDTKLRGLKKLPTHMFRVAEAFRRAGYAMSTSLH